MERLTEHYGDHIRVKGNSSIYANKERKSAYLCNAIVRLAAYEDSGLSPDEIPLWIDAESGMPEIGQRVLLYLPDKISIHAPARGATYSETFHGKKIPISIHAPARGATSIRFLRPAGFIISIHAPARGATAKA